MSPEIEDIFLEALDLLGEEREAFLQSACKSRKEIRAEIDRLLHHAEMAEDFFGEAATVMGHISHRRSFGPERLGDQIGPYRLVERQGEGGFGVVWRAIQTQPLKREVAIKVIKAGMDTREVLARFEGEREALSRMDHPGIARVLDAGESESGRPYVVMELVRGESITAFCDHASMELKDRLALFVEVCRAVSHAHQKGVIHRDLKPSNILISASGQIKVIDFGIARAVEGRLTEETLMTMAAQIMGTPAYMSPEQVAESRDLDTRTDIYALGALLYELMVGVTPFDKKTLSSRGHEELRKLILETDPQRPSHRFAGLGEQERGGIAASRSTTPAQLTAAVGGDLDWIAMKALEKDPDRRYATADAMAGDILHALENEPVSARAPSRGYLISKFIRRHRSAVVISLTMVAVLLTATGVSFWQAVRARRAEARANGLLQESKAVSSLLIDIFKLPDPEANARNIPLAEALKKASQKLDQRKDLTPDRRAQLQSALAQSYEGLGLYPEAIALLKEALRTDESSLGATSNETLEIQGRLGKMLFDCGYFAEAWETENSLLERQKKVGITSGAEHERVESILRESGLRSGKIPWPRVNPNPSGPSDSKTEAGDVSEQRKALRLKLQSQEQEMEEMGEKLGPDDPRVIQAMKNLVLGYMAAVYRDDAVRIQERIVDLLKNKYGENNHQTLENEEDLAYDLWRAGRGKEGVALRKKTIEKQRQVYGPDHPATLEAESWLISTLFFCGDTKGTVARSREVTPRLERVLGPQDRVTLNAKSFLARALLTEGETQEALGILEEIAPQMSDDTYVNLCLASGEVWFGQTDRYERTRSRMLDYCVRNRGGLIGRPDILERALFLCTLLPMRDSTQSDEILKTLKRCQEIRKAPNAPRITEPDESWREFVSGMVYLRTAQDALAAEAFGNAQQAEKPNGKAPYFAPVAAVLQGVARQHLGENRGDLTALIAKAKETMGYPASDQEPMLGKKSAESLQLFCWILLREAEKKSAASGAVPGGESGT